MRGYTEDRCRLSSIFGGGRQRILAPGAGGQRLGGRKTGKAGGTILPARTHTPARRRQRRRGRGRRPRSWNLGGAPAGKHPPSCGATSMARRPPPWRRTLRQRGWGRPRPWGRWRSGRWRKPPPLHPQLGPPPLLPPLLQPPPPLHPPRRLTSRVGGQQGARRAATTASQPSTHWKCHSWGVWGATACRQCQGVGCARARPTRVSDRDWPVIHEALGAGSQPAPPPDPNDERGCKPRPTWRISAHANQRVLREPPRRRHAADGCHRPTGARAGTAAAAPSGRGSFGRRGEVRAVAATAPPPPPRRPVTVGAAVHCDLHCWLGGGAEVFGSPSNCSPLRLPSLAMPPSPRPYARCGGWKASGGTRRG